MKNKIHTKYILLSFLLIFLISILGYVFYKKSDDNTIKNEEITISSTGESLKIVVNDTDLWQPINFSIVEEGTGKVLTTFGKDLPYSNTSHFKGGFIKDGKAYGMNSVDTGTTVCINVFWKTDIDTGKLENKYEHKDCYSSKTDVYKDNLILVDYEVNWGDYKPHGLPVGIMGPTSIQIMDLHSFTFKEIYRKEGDPMEDINEIRNIVDSLQN